MTASDPEMLISYHHPSLLEQVLAQPPLSTATAFCVDSQFAGSLCLYQIGLTQTCHCSQKAVLGAGLHCPYNKNVLMSSMLMLKKNGLLRCPTAEQRIAAHPVCEWPPL